MTPPVTVMRRPEASNRSSIATTKPPTANFGAMSFSTHILVELLDEATVAANKLRDALERLAATLTIPANMATPEGWRMEIDVP